jgi:dTDP-4-dehydrorhamnose reductase
MRVLLTGATGKLGAYLLRHLRSVGVDVTAWGGSQRGELFGTVLRPVDLADADAVAAAFADARPDAILHSAAVALISDCYRDPERARAVNVAGTARLAELAADAGARLLFVSTDIVFDGERGNYREDDPPSPLSVYGRTKADAEAAVLSTRRGVVVRVSLLFGPCLTGRPSFFDDQAAALRAGRPVKLFLDEWRTPLGLATAARALAAVASSDVTGLLHLGGPERLSRLEMGLRLAAHLGSNPELVVPVRRDDVPSPEPRPRDTSLDSSRWRSLFPREPWPDWDESLAEMDDAPR